MMEALRKKEGEAEEKERPGNVLVEDTKGKNLALLLLGREE